MGIVPIRRRAGATPSQPIQRGAGRGAESSRPVGRVRCYAKGTVRPGFVAGNPMSEWGERRAVERMPVVAGTTCAFAGRMEDIGAVRVQDVSLDGVGLVLVRKLEVGTLLAIGLSNKERGFEKTVLVRVAHVTAVLGGFLVGGSFATPLTYQELTTLVM